MGKESEKEWVHVLLLLLFLFSCQVVSYSFGNLMDCSLPTPLSNMYVCECSVQFSCSVLSDSHVTPFAARQASLSITNSQSLLKLMSITSVMPSINLILCLPFFSCLQSFPASGSFPVSPFFTSRGLSIRVSASASVLPMNIQD